MRICRSGLCIFLLLLCCSVSVGRAEGSCGTDVTWTQSGEVLTLSGSGSTDDFTTVYEIPWYAERDEIRTVVVSNGITRLGSMLFDNCEVLTSVSLPD